MPNKRPARQRNIFGPDDRRIWQPSTRKPFPTPSPWADYHERLIHTGLDILDSEGVVMPDGKRLGVIHPHEDEVFVIFPGREGEHPFIRVIRQDWETYSYLVGYKPRFASKFCEPGALMVIRRLIERPSPELIGEIVANGWKPLSFQ